MLFRNARENYNIINIASNKVTIRTQKFVYLSLNVRNEILKSYNYDVKVFRFSIRYNNKSLSIISSN